MSDAATIPATPDYEAPVPPAVKRAAQRAEQLAAEATAEARRAAGLEEAPAEPTPDAPASVEPPPAAGTTTVVADPPAPPPAPTTDWEARFRSIQGKYNTEVPRLNGQLQAAQVRITELEGQVADLNMRLRQPKPAAAAPEVTAEDIETYGQDFIDKVRTWVGTSSGADPEIARLKETVQRLETKTATTHAEAAQNAVKSFLSANLPDWEMLNTDPAFYSEWLQQADAFSGTRRMDLLHQAYTNGDGPRTLAFFKAYLAEQTVVQPAGSPPAAHTPEGAGMVPLIELAAPGRGRPGNPGAPAEKPTFTHRDIEAFYRDVTRGVYRNNEAEKNRRERQIHDAAAEGRIL